MLLWIILAFMAGCFFGFFVAAMCVAAAKGDAMAKAAREQLGLQEWQQETIKAAKKIILPLNKPCTKENEDLWVAVRNLKESEAKDD